MGTLRDSVSSSDKRQQAIEEAVKVLDAEVSDKGGISGMAIKAAYSMAKGLAPGMIHKLMNGLMDDFLDALQPYYDESKAQGVDFRAHVQSKPADVANALLKVTDARATRSNAGALKKGYEKLRPSAQKHVEQALPRLADMVKKYAS